MVFAALGLSLSVHAAAAAAEVDPALLAKGAYLARAGDCVACHTSKDGKEFAGGLPMETPIGMIYSSNITPDMDTGIGHYSFEDFDKAVRQGVAKEGYTLYPAMPYPSYARIQEQDMRALYAYFMHDVPAVKQQSRAVDIPWPLSMRWPLSVWRKMFAPDPVAFTPLAGQDKSLARGAYLVEGLGHCGSCHTPRAFSLQEKALSEVDGKQFLAGGAPLEGWNAKSLRGDHRDGLGSWSEAELVQYFKTGRTDRAAAFGSMSEVIVQSLQYLSDSDLTAIAHYLKSLPAVDPADKPLHDDGRTAAALHDLEVDTLGARIYADSCMACHRSDGKGYAQTFPGLASNPVLNGEDPSSLIRIVLGGATLPGTLTAPTAYTMPAFGWRLSAEETAAVVSFIRGSWGNVGGAVTAAQVTSVREEMQPSMLLVPGLNEHPGAIRKY
nr:c-type cytochrome [Pseudomonas syringae]